RSQTCRWEPLLPTCPLFSISNLQSLKTCLRELFLLPLATFYPPDLNTNYRNGACLRHQFQLSKLSAGLDGIGIPRPIPRERRRFLPNNRRFLCKHFLLLFYGILPQFNLSVLLHKANISRLYVKYLDF